MAIAVRRPPIRLSVPSFSWAGPAMISSSVPIVEVARGLHALGNDRGFKLLVVAHPMWEEVERGPPSALHALAEPLAAEEIPFLDLLEHFRDEIPTERLWDYYYRRDQHNTPAGYRVFAEVLAERVELPRGERDKRMRDLAAAYADRLEHYCILAPYQWFNFFDFWHEQP